MTGSLVVHVGAPAGGAGHLQRVLASGGCSLAGADVRVLGSLPAPNATTGLEAELDRVRRLLRDTRGCRVLSAGDLTAADRDHGGWLLGRIGADPAATTAVISARDLGRRLPALWQAAVTGGSVRSLHAHLAEAIAPQQRAAVDVAALAGRWSELVGPERTVVVPVPRHGIEPQLLWARFVAAGGLPDQLTGDVAAMTADPPGHAGDVRLSAGQTELLRALNGVLRAERHPVHLQQALRARLVVIWRNLGGPAGPPPAVPAELRPAVRAWAADEVTRIRELGVRVAGPLTDLEPRFGPPQPAEAVDPALARDILTLLAYDPLGAPPATALTRAVRRWRHRHRPVGSRPPVPHVSPAPDGADQPCAGADQPWAGAGARSMSGSR